MLSKGNQSNIEPQKKQMSGTNIVHLMNQRKKLRQQHKNFLSAQIVPEKQPLYKLDNQNLF
jgi:hypothetical protein